MTKRVILYTQAQKLLSSSRKSARQRSFWKRILEILGIGKYKIVQLTPLFSVKDEESLEKKGFVPFVKIHDLKVFINTDNNTKEHKIVVLYKDSPLDIDNSIQNVLESDNGFSIKLFSFLYLTCVKDDYNIDTEEMKALNLLIEYLQPSKDAILTARKVIYTFLLNEFLEDKKLQAQEKKILRKIRILLNLDTKSSSIINDQVFLEKVNEINNKPSITREDISLLYTLGRDLGIDEYTLSSYIYKLEDRLFEEELDRGNFPIVEDVPVILRRGEIAHFVSPVTVVQLKTERRTYRTYAGTRIKIGKMPIYLGGSSPHVVERDVLKEVGYGDFVVTNKRIILSGTKINYKIPLNKINDINLFSDAIQIMDETRYGGRYYKINDPSKAEKIIRKLVENI